MHVRTDNGWNVVDHAPTSERSITVGSNFMVGNGYLGYRGTRPDQRAVDFVGCVVTDTYDMADGVWRELCTAPNGLYVGLSANGAPLSMDESRPAEVELTLSTGEYRHRSTYRNPHGSATVSVRRFASLDDLHLVMQQVTIVAEQPLELSVEPGVDSDVWSLNGDHLGAVRSTDEPGLHTARTTTVESGIDIAVAAAVSVFVDRAGPDAATRRADPVGAVDAAANSAHASESSFALAAGDSVTVVSAM